MTPSDDIESERARLENGVLACRRAANEVKHEALRVAPVFDGELERLVNQLERRKARLARYADSVMAKPPETLAPEWTHVKWEAEDFMLDLEVAISELEACAIKPHRANPHRHVATSDQGIEVEGSE